MTDRADSPYRIRPSIDLPLLGLGVAGTLAVAVEVPPPACLPHCLPPDGLNGLDRLVVGSYSGVAHTVASALVAALVVAPFVLDALLGRGRGWWRFALVYLQALAGTAALVQLTKFAIGRVAPLVYATPVPEAAYASADASRSFISGHTATAAVCVAVALVSLGYRRPGHRLRWPLLLLGLAVVAGVAGLKIVAGYHYPSDVVAGGLVGASLGVLVPAAHARGREPGRQHASRSER